MSHARQWVILTAYTLLLYASAGSAYHWGRCHMVIWGIAECGVRTGFAPDEPSISKPQRIEGAGMTIMAGSFFASGHTMWAPGSVAPLDVHLVSEDR